MDWILHFSRITERVVDIKSPLYRGSNAPLEQPEEEEEEEEEEERETRAEERERARRASREEVLFCARQKQLCRHRSKSKLEIQ
jgi:hypothetical protein